MFAVEFVPAAARQAANARDWWFEHRNKARTAFDDDLAELVERLAQAPLLVGVRIAERPGVRRALLRRVRYYVYFTVAETVTIIAVWHASRGHQPL